MEGQNSKNIMYGLDVLTGTLKPIGTTDVAALLFAGMALSGNQQDTNIAADYIVGNASGSIAFTDNVGGTTIYSTPVKTNHARSILLTVYLSAYVANPYIQGIQAVETISAGTNYRAYTFAAGGSTWTPGAVGWSSHYVSIMPFSPGGIANRSNVLDVLPPEVRFSLTLPAGVSTGFWVYSLHR